MDFAYAYARRLANKPFLSTVPKTRSREPLEHFETPSMPVSSLPLMTSIPGITISLQTSLLLPSLSQSQLTSSKSTRQPRSSPRSKTRSILPHQLQVPALSRFSPLFCGNPQFVSCCLTRRKTRWSMFGWLSTVESVFQPAPQSRTTSTKTSTRPCTSLCFLFSRCKSRGMECDYPTESRRGARCGPAASHKHATERSYC